MAAGYALPGGSDGNAATDDGGWWATIAAAVPVALPAVPSRHSRSLADQVPPPAAASAASTGPAGAAAGVRGGEPDNLGGGSPVLDGRELPAALFWTYR